MEVAHFCLCESCVYVKVVFMWMCVYVKCVFWSVFLREMSVHMKSVFIWNVCLCEMCVYVKCVFMWNVCLCEMHVYVKCVFMWNVCLCGMCVWVRYVFMWNVCLCEICVYVKCVGSAEYCVTTCSVQSTLYWALSLETCQQFGFNHRTFWSRSDSPLIFIFIWIDLCNLEFYLVVF